jgi:hypothetical protein
LVVKQVNHRFSSFSIVFSNLFQLFHRFSHFSQLKDVLDFAQLEARKAALGTEHPETLIASNVALACYPRWI